MGEEVIFVDQATLYSGLDIELEVGSQVSGAISLSGRRFDLGSVSSIFLRPYDLRRLVDAGDLQLGLFDETDLAEITAPAYPGERLVVCRNPALATERTRKREALLVATACSSPPAGRARWTLELLADEMVRLTGHASLSRETVRRWGEELEQKVGERTEELNARNRQLAAVGAIMAAADDAHDLEGMLHRCLDVVLQETSADAAAVRLVDGRAGRAAAVSVGLYTFYNFVNAAASYPAGALGDRFGKRPLLALGYLMAAITCAGFILEQPTMPVLVFLFGLAGFHGAFQASLEKSLAAELLPAAVRGSGFGVLATANGIGDLVSSVAVGALWSSVSPAAGFLYAGIFSALGAILIYWWRGRRD